MNITITGRKISIKDRFRERVEKKLNKLDKLFGTEAEAQVTLSYLKDQFTVEITIRNTRNSMIFRSEKTTGDMFDSLEAAADSIVRQIVKNKGKLESRMRAGAYTDAAFLAQEEREEELDEPHEYKIVRSKRFAVKPMEVEEAILQMNMLDHEFFMFRNIQTEEINVVYRRHNGDYGLLEPED